MAQNSVVAEGEEMNTLLSEYLNMMTEDGSDSDTEEPDTAGPIINLQTSSTENTITVIVTATDESGLAESETYTYYLNSVQQGVATTESTKTYTGLTASTEYTIKVLVKDALGNASEKEIKVSTTEAEVPSTTDEAKPNGDQDGPTFDKTTPLTDATGSNTVVIPGGFHLDAESGTSVEEGIVIEDENGNQFVWIPTGTYQTSSGIKTNNLARRVWGNSGQAIEPTEVTASNGDGAVNDKFYGEGDSRSIAYSQIAAFKTSAESVANGGNGGFYIGRYEQGQGNVCKSGVTPYTNLTRDQAKSQAEAMYSENSNVVSELISSYAWDTALNFICQTNSAGYSLANARSSSYGNIGTHSKKNTGIDVNDDYSNIHDLLGNCVESTTEYASGNYGSCVYRGNSYMGSSFYPSTHYSYDASDSNDYCSFRIQLYVK